MRGESKGARTVRVGVLVGSSISLILAGCTKNSEPTPDLENFRDEIASWNATAAPSENGSPPPIPKELKKLAEEVTPAAEEDLRAKRNEAMKALAPKKGDPADPVIDAAVKCTEDLQKPDPEQQSLENFNKWLAECKKVAAQLDAKAGADAKSDAFNNFLRAAMAIGAIVAIAHGNYALAAFLFNQAMRGGGKDGDDDQTPKSTDPAIAESADNQTPPEGYTELRGGARSGYKVSFSRAHNQFVLQTPKSMTVYLKLNSQDAKRFSENALAACLPAIMIAPDGREELMLRGSPPCPNVAVIPSFDPKGYAGVQSIGAERPASPPQSPQQASSS